MNKMFKKILAVAAVAATAATMSVSAFATEANYVEPTETTGASVNVEAWTNSGNGQYTVMVVPQKTVAEGETLTYTSDEIYYINQGSQDDMASLLTGGMLIKSELEPGTYLVRIGSDVANFTTQEYTFVVEETATGYKISCYVADTYATAYIGTTEATKEADGTLSFTNFAAGAYDLIVKAPGALNRTINVTVTDADVAVSTADAPTTLVYGATAADAEQIGLSDLLDIQANYKKATGEEGYSINLDFDRDGTIGLSDLLEVQANYKKTIAEAYGN